MKQHYIIRRLDINSIIEENGEETNARLKAGIILSKSHDYMEIRPTAVKFAKNHKDVYAVFFVHGMAWCNFLFSLSFNSKGKQILEFCRCCGVRGAYEHWDTSKKFVKENWRIIQNLSNGECLEF